MVKEVMNPMTGERFPPKRIRGEECDELYPRYEQLDSMRRNAEDGGDMNKSRGVPLRFIHLISR